MAKTMSPSDKPITKGQIGKFYDVLANALAKSGLPSGPVQQVLATQGATLAEQFVVSLRKSVEAITSMIVRTVTVIRTRTPQEVLDATGRHQYTDATVVAAMPQGTGGEVQVHFFKLGRYVSDDELEKEYTLRGLVPSDPYSLAAVNEADPAFADEHSNGTHWKDKDGKWCFAAFCRWPGEHHVHVDRHADGWYAYWWFGGLRKER